MKRISLVLVVAVLGALLSGCESLQAQKSAAAPQPAAQAAPAVQNPPAPPTIPAAPASAASGPATAPQPAPAATGQQQAAPVSFFLAQPEKDQGLRELKLKDGSLWVLPQPVLVRNDLTRVTPLEAKDGKGVVRFDFNPAGAKKLADLSQRFQGKRLVLVVGHEIIAIPQIAGRMNDGTMFIVVPSAAQAQAITRAIAGQAQ